MSQDQQEDHMTACRCARGALNSTHSQIKLKCTNYVSSRFSTNLRSQGNFRAEERFFPHLQTPWGTS